MPNKMTRVLVVEDNPGDMRLLREALKPYEDRYFDLAHENCLEGALRHLRQGEIDVILLDLFLPESTGLETLRKVQEVVPKIPIIILTGIYTDWLAFQAIRSGAFCYLSKDELSGQPLSRALRYYAGLKLATMELS